MLHLRLVVPSRLIAEVRAALADDPTTTNLIHLPGSGIQPEGDLLLCDVARESASRVLTGLRDLGVEQHGSISVQNVDLELSYAARAAQRAAPGFGADAVVWEEVERRTQEESALSATFLGLMALATTLAMIGVLLDSPILVIGAMVIGPDFGPAAGICVGWVTGRRSRVARSLQALLVGYPFAIAFAILATWVLTALGMLDASMLHADRPLTSFVFQPDALSFVVALIAGCAGIISLTSAKSGGVIGVAISITTIPASGNVAAALAYGDLSQAGGSLAQLIVNQTGIVVAGTLTLMLQRYAWRRFGTPAERQARWHERRDRRRSGGSG
jgi:uncharacterized hydrophobic protein (TIGR00271 family)